MFKCSSKIHVLIPNTKGDCYQTVAQNVSLQFIIHSIINLETGAQKIVEPSKIIKQA